MSNNEYNSNKDLYNARIYVQTDSLRDRNHRYLKQQSDIKEAKNKKFFNRIKLLTLFLIMLYPTYKAVQYLYF